jgi:phosphatidylserine decarboxylase
MEIKYINRSTNEVETERPPGEGLLKFLYQNAVGKGAILPFVKRKFVTQWYGRWMDRPASKKRIASFVDSLNIDMSESRRSIHEFESFNDFFYRKLKPGARNIQQGLVSPGDGKLLAFEQASDANSFYVKGKEFTLYEFLKDDDLADKYHDASMVILRLAPNDYHRYHFPYDGIPSRSERIDGVYYSVSPISVTEMFTEVFCENKREICRLKTQKKGEMLLIPVGATMVGSIQSTYKPDEPVKKGDEMGYFAFGGSTIVLLFDPDSFKLDEDLLENTRKQMETAVKMGEKIASD